VRKCITTKSKYSYDLAFLVSVGYYAVVLDSTAFMLAVVENTLRQVISFD